MDSGTLFNTAKCGAGIPDHVDSGGFRFGSIMGVQSIDVEEACFERSELEGN